MFRQGNGLFDQISQSRSSRNNNRIYRKYSVIYENLLDSFKFKNKKKINEKISTILGSWSKNSFSVDLSNLELKRKKLIISSNLVAQLKNFKFFFKKNLTSGNRVYKFYNNLVRYYYDNSVGRGDKNFDFSDKERKLKLLSFLYKNNFESTDLKIQQNFSKLNRWGVELGRGGFDWFWLRLGKTANVDKRVSVESERFIDSWGEESFDFLRKNLKYLTENQYTLKVMRSKYFNNQLSKNFTFYGLDNNMFNLKYDMLKNFYNLGLFGYQAYGKGLGNSNLSKYIERSIFDRLKQPLRVYMRERSPYLRNNYVILHQKVLKIYLNKKIKYNRVRFFIKPLQMYFRDFFRFSFDLKNINHVSRNELNLINLNIFSKFNSKHKVSRVKKLILNARILFKKNINNTYVISKKNLRIFNFLNTILKNFYNDLTENTLNVDQFKKIIK